MASMNRNCMVYNTLEYAHAALSRQHGWPQASTEQTCTCSSSTLVVDTGWTATGTCCLHDIHQQCWDDEESVQLNMEVHVLVRRRLDWRLTLVCRSPCSRRCCFAASRCRSTRVADCSPAASPHVTSSHLHEAIQVPSTGVTGASAGRQLHRVTGDHFDHRQCNINKDWHTTQLVA